MQYFTLYTLYTIQKPSYNVCMQDIDRLSCNWYIVFSTLMICYEKYHNANWGKHSILLRSWGSLKSYFTRHTGEIPFPLIIAFKCSPIILFLSNAKQTCWLLDQFILFWSELTNHNLVWIKFLIFFYLATILDYNRGQTYHLSVTIKGIWHKRRGWRCSAQIHSSHLF